ncbi:MAG: glutathione-disulfide reductase [Tepidimonas sp.]|uniref:glutathione-disulfide reductase n=1 Tax=Tepidimonas sp. TaxID=2002775 RepID=UPI00298F024B|nr:glutathione-disulfide reductase [Tepidimonas sp.]MDW8337025.1 glutathione-disulfide reductase [Tepidimonas sp.]
MSGYDFDLFVIGGGSGGVRAARLAAQRGARVALAEARGRAGLGGTCVTLGCIPKKLYHYAAHYAEAAEEARGYGWHGPAAQLDWGELKRRRAAEIARLNGVYEQLLRQAGVTLLQGHARLLDPHTVQLTPLQAAGQPTPQTWRAERILIATGGTPHVPHFVGREHVITSNDVFDLEPLPARMVVVGGGYIACEFASIFLGLGVRVTQLYRGEQILRGFDDDVRGFLAEELQKKGLDLRLHTGVVAVQRRADGLHVTLENGQTVVADAVLYATGRVPNVAGLGLEALGVAQGAQGALIVDDHFRTNIPSIHAVGDVVARAQLTPVALAEAMALVDHLFGPAPGAAPRQARYDLIPTAVFTLPSVGAVGLTETQARQRCGRLRIYRSSFRPLRHTLSGRDERALVKLVVDDASDRVVGLHMVGPEAGEIVQGFAVALRCGATKAQFDATLGIHPTLAEEFVTLREPVLVT